MALKSYRSLDVWKRAIELTIAAYGVADLLPASEVYGLGAQMRRAAVSIAANIAEGYGRDHRGDYLRHLSFAKGSLLELETLLILAVRLKRVARQEVVASWELAQAVGKMLRKLVVSLKE